MLGSPEKQSGCTQLETDLVRCAYHELDEAAMARIEGHLGTCPTCRDFVEFIQRCNALIKEGGEFDDPGEPCPAPELIVRLEARMLEKAIVEHVRAHVLHCKKCRNDYLLLTRLSRTHYEERLFQELSSPHRAAKAENKRESELESFLKKVGFETETARELFLRHFAEPSLLRHFSSQAPSKLKVDEITRHYNWYAENLWRQQIFDPRGYRVRFFRTSFLRLLKVKNRLGNEPKGRRAIMEKIEAGQFRSRAGELGNGVTTQARRTLASALPMTRELSWLRSIANSPDWICTDWRIPYWRGPQKDTEAYIKNFGTADHPLYRVMVCKVNGTNRDVIAVFSRRAIGKRELERQEYPAAA